MEEDKRKNVNRGNKQKENKGRQRKLTGDGKSGAFTQKDREIKTLRNTSRQRKNQNWGV